MRAVMSICCVAILLSGSERQSFVTVKLRSFELAGTLGPKLRPRTPNSGRGSYLEFSIGWCDAIEDADPAALRN